MPKRRCPNSISVSIRNMFWSLDTVGITADLPMLNKIILYGSVTSTRREESEKLKKGSGSIVQGKVYLKKKLFFFLKKKNFFLPP